MNDCLFLLDYRRTTAGRRCHCDLVPSVLFTERSETSKERESTLMSVIIRKEETESHLLGWSSWHEELGFDKRIKTIAVRLNRQWKRDPIPPIALHNIFLWSSWKPIPVLSYTFRVVLITQGLRIDYSFRKISLLCLLPFRPEFACCLQSLCLGKKCFSAHPTSLQLCLDVLFLVLCWSLRLPRSCI